MPEICQKLGCSIPENYRKGSIIHIVENSKKFIEVHKNEFSIMIIKSEQCHYDVSPCPEGYQWHNNGGRIHYSCAKYAEDGETFLNNVICSGYACLG